MGLFTCDGLEDLDIWTKWQLEKMKTVQSTWMIYSSQSQCRWDGVPEKWSKAAGKQTGYLDWLSSPDLHDDYRDP